MSGPLSEVKVLDLSRIMAGPWAGQLLADLGADVIKVERPGVGDDTRSWGPPYLNADSNGQAGASAYFLSVNRGKRSIEIDLATAQGQELVRDLARGSDILLENFKPNTLSKYGLGYEDLAPDNPGLIYCSITGFGQTGPRRDNSAYDFMIQAMGGLMSVTGKPDDEPGGGPLKVGVPIVDIMTGMYAAVGVLAALEKRRNTGTGEYIDLAMLDVEVAMLANQAMNYLVSGNEPKRYGNKHPNIQPQGVYACLDGRLALAVGNDLQFRGLCAALERPDLAANDLYRTNEGRVRGIDVLDALIAQHLAKETVGHWLESLERQGVPCGPINTISAVFEDEQVKHREMVRSMPGPDGLLVPTVVSPLRFKDAALKFERMPPNLGEHTEEIIRELQSTTSSASFEG